MRLRTRRERALAAVAGLATFCVYMVGSGRAFGYDAAVTMENFVDGPPPWALTRQLVFNNHPLFSLMEGGVADVVGTSEVAMRVAPALFAGMSVALVVWRLGVRWGWPAGLAAGATLAAHPMLAPLARDARGYSLAVLAIVVMGIAVFDVRRPWLFGVAGAVGIGTHLYVAVPVAAIAGWLLVGGELDRRWRSALMAMVTCGLAVYAGLLDGLGRGGRVFRPGFPIDAGRALLGDSLLAVLALGSLMLILIGSIRLDRRSVALVGVMVAGVLGPWLIGPPDLYPRFVYWAVPAVAAAVGAVVHAHPRSVLLVPVALIGCILPQIDGWSQDELPNRTLARHVRSDACAVTWSYEALRWYAELIEGQECGVVALLLPEATEPQTSKARERWPVECWAIDGAEVRGLTEGDC